MFLALIEEGSKNYERQAACGSWKRQGNGVSLNAFKRNFNFRTSDLHNCKIINLCCFKFVIICCNTTRKLIWYVSSLHSLVLGCSNPRISAGSKNQGGFWALQICMKARDQSFLKASLNFPKSYACYSSQRLLPKCTRNPHYLMSNATGSQGSPNPAQPLNVTQKVWLRID